MVVVKNEGGKEIGGGNHYCTICRAPVLPTPPVFQLRLAKLMITRTNATSDNIHPLSDPEAILKAGNAEKRRHKKDSNRPVAPLPSSSILAPTIMSETIIPPGGQEPPADSTRDSTRTADGSDMSTAKEWFKAVLKIQHSAITQAQDDRRQALEDRRADRKLFLDAHQANSDRIRRLEDLLLAMNIKNEVGARAEQPAPGRVDLQKFRTSDGPIYRGPFQETEPFLRWIHGVQIFFETKSVGNAADKIKILGNLVAETNLQSFYANEASGFLHKSWEEFKTRMFDFALPTNWRSGLQRQIRKLEMTSTETFLEYSTRARTLQSLFNFDADQTSKLGDLQLAQFAVYGLTDALQDRIYERQLLEVNPFKYGPFEKQANASFLAIQRPTELPTTAKPPLNAPPTLGRDEFIWRVHAYLDSQGLCHFCKKHCGNAAGACPGPIDRSHINIPVNFQTPTKPLDYVAPRAWSKPIAGPGRSSQPPAGRPPARAASVAGIAEVTPLEARVAGLTVDAAIREDDRHDYEFDDESCFPALGTAAVAALEDLDSQLLQNEIDQATQASTGWTGNLADDIAVFQLRLAKLMITRTNATSDNIHPLSDPEAILKAGNAEKRRHKKDSNRPVAPLPSSSILAPTIMSETIIPPGGQEPPADSTRDSTRTADGSDMSTAKEWFKAVLKIQHSAITQAQDDRRQALEDRRADRKLFLDAHQANSDRIRRLEDLLLAMNIKNEVGARAEQPAPGRVDLQKFRTSDGPIYRGPFQETEPFLRWIHGVQIFFETKSVGNAADKIKILGNLVAETNLQSFYANEASGFLHKSWEEFKTRMFDFALPTNWRSGLQRQIRKLEMTSTETFLEYSTRARTLQSLFNFDADQTSKLGDLQLAQFAVYGLTDALQDRIYERQLLEVNPFKYGPFEKQANASFLAIQRPTELPTTAKPPLNAPPTLGRDEFIWRVHAYLDSQGLCHFCKKHCGNAAGACPGPIDRSHINIPVNFQTPTKPLDYVAPRAWSKPIAGPGRSSQPPAGRPPARAASVAGIAEVTPLEARVAGLTVDAAIREDDRHDYEFDDESCFPALGTAAVAALEDLDSQLLQNEIDQATQASTGWTGNLADDIAGY
ncbi:hypothetical protein PGTUg99_035282 [Puccinia graminis f. sp. tritici]|nr:hypothetical protein PGTUg99_035282 [Puccinia graminis f. sp. tritici]